MSAFLVGGGGGTPPGGAGGNTQVIFNDAGAYGGDAGMTYNKTTDALTLLGALDVGGGVTVSGGNVAVAVGGLRVGSVVGLNWTSGISLQAAAPLSWSSTADQAGTRDLYLSRSAASVAKFTTDGGSTFAAVLASYFGAQSLRTGTASGVSIWTLVADVVGGVYDWAGNNAAALLMKMLVEANTAGSGSPNIITVFESRTLFTNEGATAENYHTLPPAAAGHDLTFVVQDADGLRITADTGDTIRVGGTVSGAAGFIRSFMQGATVRLRAINATEWIAEATGTWTVDS